MKYSISNSGKSNKLIQIEIDFGKVGEVSTDVFLPRWRPGRYIFVDYVQFVRDLRFEDVNGNDLEFSLEGVSSWKVNNEGKSFRAKYQYYCKDLDAGSTWVDEESLYMNPVNCLMYTNEEKDQECEVDLFLDYDCEIIVGAEVRGNSFSVKSFDVLADSPFFACKNIIHERFEVEGVDFGVSFWGECKPDMKKIVDEFVNYTKEQFAVFGDFPVKKYEYLFVITPFAKYHGVEHQYSTVIALGPGYNLMTKKLDDLMGVSSHELFHTWNVKNIRPIEMYPYDFQNENFNKLGYVTEGVTTYYGDLMLKRSGYFNTEGYFKELETTFKRHFENEGRFNKSVADASHETWIDGYSKTAPHFKTNIYVEGSLCALMTDLVIRLNSNGTNSLDSVMKRMYDDYGKQEKGYSEEDYLAVLKEFGGEKVESIITDHLYGVKDYEPSLKALLAEFGVDLYQEENDSKVQSLFGIQMNIDYGDIIERVSLCSEANDKGFTKGAKIIAINGFAVNGRDVNSWVKYFSDEQEMKFTLLKDGRVIEKSLTINDVRYFQKRKLRISEGITEVQKSRLEEWFGTSN